MGYAELDKEKTAIYTLCADGIAMHADSGKMRGKKHDYVDFAHL
jgi:hypothetical protein